MRNLYRLEISLVFVLAAMVVTVVSVMLSSQISMRMPKTV
jgi:hypothetical protein